MEVTTLYIRLLINLWLMLAMQVQDGSYAQNAYAAFLRVVPPKLQYFEYESISLSCWEFDGLLGWRVIRKIPGTSTPCGNSWGLLKGSVCIIQNVYVEDSGEYWCETGDGRKSSSVNIIVTGGSVILEIPVPSVLKGNAVTLHCKNKTTASNISASFYKNDLLIKNSSTGEMTIHDVTQFHEGLYKCKISGGEESPGSWLTVTDYYREIPFCSDQLPVLLYLLVRTVATVLWVALLLVVLRKRDSGKHGGKNETINFQR